MRSEKCFAPGRALGVAVLVLAGLPLMAAHEVRAHVERVNLPEGVVRVVARAGSSAYAATGVVWDEHTVVTHTMLLRLPEPAFRVDDFAGRHVEARFWAKDDESAILLLRVPENTLPPLVRREGVVRTGVDVRVVGLMGRQKGEVLGRLSGKAIQHFLVSAPVFPGVSGAAALAGDGCFLGLVRGRFNGQSFFSPGRDKKGHAEGPLLLVHSGSTLEHLVLELDVHRRVRRPWVGLEAVQDATGFWVGGVAPQSPAEKAGIRPRDRLARIGGRGISTWEDLWGALNVLEVGRPVAFVLQSPGHQEDRTVQVHVEEKPRRQDTVFWSVRSLDPHEPSRSEWTAVREGGGWGMVLDRRHGMEEGADQPPSPRGIRVLRVARDGKAYQVGIRADDVLLRLADKALDSPLDWARLLKELRAAPEGGDMPLEILRNGEVVVHRVGQDIMVKVPVAAESREAELRAMKARVAAMEKELRRLRQERRSEPGA